jgi:ABC-type polysaccharide transport system permease subunit
MMTIAVLRDCLLWCAIVNYTVLFAWFLAFTCAHSWLYRLHARWFGLSENQFDVIHYSGMAAYKIAALSLNVAPFIALLIATRHGM